MDSSTSPFRQMIRSCIVVSIIFHANIRRSVCTLRSLEKMSSVTERLAFICEVHGKYSAYRCASHLPVACQYLFILIKGDSSVLLSP